MPFILWHEMTQENKNISLSVTDNMDSSLYKKLALTFKNSLANNLH